MTDTTGSNRPRSAMGPIASMLFLILLGAAFPIVFTAWALSVWVARFVF